MSDAAGGDRSEGRFLTRVKEHDIVLGRGIPHTKFRGNIWFRALIATYRKEYMSTGRQRKKQKVAIKAFREIKEQGGRCVRYATQREKEEWKIPEDEDAWVADTTDEAFMMKVKQSLREGSSDTELEANEHPTSHSLLSGGGADVEDTPYIPIFDRMTTQGGNDVYPPNIPNIPYSNVGESRAPLFASQPGFNPTNQLQLLCERRLQAQRQEIVALSLQRPTGASMAHPPIAYNAPLVGSAHLPPLHQGVNGNTYMNPQGFLGVNTGTVAVAPPPLFGPILAALQSQNPSTATFQFLPGPGLPAATNSMVAPSQVLAFQYPANLATHQGLLGPNQDYPLPPATPAALDPVTLVMHQGLLQPNQGSPLPLAAPATLDHVTLVNHRGLPLWQPNQGYPLPPAAPAFLDPVTLAMNALFPPSPLAPSYASLALPPPAPAMDPITLALLQRNAHWPR